MSNLKKKKYIAGLLIVVLLIGIVGLFSYGKVDKYKGLVKVKNAKLLGSVLNTNAMTSKGTEEVKYNLKYTLDPVSGLTSRNVIIRGTLNSNYASFKEINKTGITSVLKNSGKEIEINVSDVPLGIEQNLDILIQVTNAPNNESIIPEIFIKEATGEETRTVGQAIKVETNSVLGIVYDENDIPVGNIELSISKDGREIKRTYTSDDGIYNFSDLESGSYIIKVEEEIYEIVSGSSVSESNPNNIIKVREIDKFNIETHKYIEKLDLVINGKKENYSYKDAEKVVQAVKNAKTISGQIEYKIVVRNKGEKNTAIERVVDEPGEGLEFKESNNTGWKLEDGLIKYKPIEGSVLSPKEKREIKLVLDITNTNEIKTYINKLTTRGEIKEKVAFVVDNRTVKEVSVVEGDKVERPNLEIDNLDGWYTDKNYTNKYKFTNEVYKDLILYAKTNHDTNEYTVRFIDQGQVVTTETVEEGNKANRPSDPEKEGYRFECWKKNNTCYDFNEEVNEDFDLESSYNVITYNIAYDLDGGEVNPDNRTTYTIETETFTLNNPSKIGHTFTGWTGTGLSQKTNTVTIEQGSTGNREYKANYEINSYQLEIDPKGGTYSGELSITGDYGEIVSIANPSKEGYTFTGWSLTGSGTYNNGTFTFGDGNAKLEAEYEINRYNIDYDYTSCSLTNEEIAALNNKTSYTIEDNNFNLNNPSKYGYVFEGWTGTDLSEKTINVTVDTSKIKNLEYAANCRLQEFTVTFKDGDTVLGTKQAEYKKKVTPIDTPEKNGYTFSKWLLNNEEYDFDTSITEDITLQAEFSLNNYTITYEGLTDEERTSLNNPGNYSIETNSFILNNPADRLDIDQGGEVFVGWQEENDTTPSMTVTLPDASNLGNKKYTAIWNERQPNVYNITYNLNGGTLEEANPTTYKKSQLPITLNNPTKTGYTFLGWTGSNGDTPEDVTIPANTTGDLSYTANFRINKYQLEIDPKGGTYIGDLLLEEDYGTVVIINEPTKTGYNFTGWTLTGSGTYSDGNYTFSNGNGKLEASWEVINYTIDYEGITEEERTYLNNPTSYNVETASFTLNNPENRLDEDEGGEVFVGWKENNESTPSTSITLPDLNNLGNKSYTAIWNERQPNVYNITYNLNGGTLTTPNPITYKKSQLPITLNNPAKTGYTFDGWTGSNGTTPGDVTIPVNTTGDLNYVANFTINEYQLEIDPKGGTYPGELLVTEEYGTAINISDPVKTGYTFNNWTLTGSGTFDNGIYTFDAGNGKLEANYTIDNYTISYDYSACALTNEEITALNNRTSYNVETDTFSLNNPSKYGYVFEGWTGTSLSEKTNSVTINKGSTGNREYTANCRLDKFTVTFKDGDTVLDTKQVDYNTSVTAISDPEKNGYTFSKWLLNGEEYNFNNLVTEDITLQADYTLNTYTINYEEITDEERASLNNPTSYSIESTVFTLNNPADRLDEDQGGEIFVGWQEENDTTPSMSVNLPNASSLGNKTYTAIWNHKEPNTYNITYNLNGGTVETPNPITYKKSELPITLNNPTKEGYTFIGWTGSNGETPTNVTIPTGTTGDLHYTANFRINEFNVEFYNMTAEGAYEKINEATLVKEYDTLLTNEELPSVSLRGYTFKYWSLDKTNEYNISSPIINNIKLYAVYQKDVYPITYNLDGGTVSGNPSSYSVDTNTFTLHNPTKTGYTFTGWTGSNGDTPETTVTLPETELGPKSYTAHYSLNTYNISYNYTSCALTPEEITALNNKTSYTVEDTDFALNNPSKYGYIFEGWTGTDLSQKTMNVTVETNKAKNLSYTANCILDTYDVEFYNMESDETTYTLDTTVSNVEYNTAVGSSSIPTVNLLGYTFKYWSLDKENEFDLSTPITADTKLYAVYEIDTYDITYNLKDGVVSGNPDTYTIKDLPITLNNPTKTGYTFIGWTGSNGNTPSNVTIPVNTTGDLDYVAVYNIDEFDVEFYNMKSDGSYELKTTIEDIDYNTTIPSNEVPTVTLRGYTFDYWSLDKSTEFNLSTPITSNLKIYAMYTKDVYPITYDLDGGSLGDGVTNPDSYSVDTTSFTLNNPTKTGYTFIGWTGSNGDDPLKVVTLPEEELGPKSYTANYTINKYTVTYMNGNDKFLEQTNIDYNTTTTAPSTNPTKVHNIFLKWLKEDNTEFDFSTPITEDITLYASWEEVEAPSISHTPTSWVGDKVTVTVSSTHPEYTYMYKVGSGDYQEYTEAFEVTENTTVYAYSVKNTITSTETSHIINNIDKINPTIIDLDNTESTPVSLTIKVTAQDNESGLDHFIIYVDNTSVYVGDSYTTGLNDEKEFTYTITNLEQRTDYTVKVEAYDKVGNMSYDEEVFTTPSKHYVARVVGPTYDSPYDINDESNYYETLKEALESDTCQGASCVIQILDEVEETNTITNGQDVTIDLNGLQITGKQDKAFENNGTLKIIDKNENAIGKVYSEGTAIINNGTLFVGENEDELYVDANEPIIEGSVTGINSPGELHFLDGKIIGSSSNGALKGSAPITPYSYNASVDTTGGKEIATLEVIADAEARINSVYYTKAQEAVDSSKNGSYAQPEGTAEIMSQIQSKSDYRFVYDENTGTYKSNNKGIHNSYADSYVIFDLTNEANDKVLSVDTSISSQGQKDWGYVTITNSNKAPSYDDENGRIIYTSGTNVDNINYVLEKGKKYYVHFGYRKDEGNNAGDDTFTINSIKLADYIVGQDNDYLDNLISDTIWHFTKQADGTYISNYANNNYANSIAHSYIKIDLTGITEPKQIAIDMSKAATNGVVGYVTINNTKDTPSPTDEEGRQIYITSTTARQVYYLDLIPDSVNYVHFCDKKNSSNTGYPFVIYDVKLTDNINNEHINSDITPGQNFYMYETNADPNIWKDLSGNDNRVVENLPNWDDVNGGFVSSTNNSYAYITGGITDEALDEETVEVEFSTTDTNLRKFIYAGSVNERIIIATYSSNTLVVCNKNTKAKLYDLPEDFFDGEKKNLIVTYKDGNYEVYYNKVKLEKRTDSNWWDSNNNTYIGSKAGDNGYNFKGTIYKVNVYNRELSEDEITGTRSNTGLLLSLDGSDHVKTNSTSAFINNNQYQPSTTADSYMTFDLTNSGTKTITVNAEISSELNRDYGCIYVNTSSSTQACSSGSNRYAYLSGDVAAQDYSVTLTGGRVNYVHFDYSKNGNVDGGTDTFKINYVNYYENSSSTVPTYILSNQTDKQPITPTINVNEEKDTVQLLRNVTLSSPLYITETRDVELDLNGYTLTTGSNDYVIDNQGSLTIVDTDFDNQTEAAATKYMNEQTAFNDEYTTKNREKEEFYHDKQEEYDEEYQSAIDRDEAVSNAFYNSYLDYINSDAYQPQSEYRFGSKSTGQKFIVPYTGEYKIEAWGAQGNNASTKRAVGGKGAYTSGTINLTKGDILYIYVGEHRTDRDSSFNAGSTGGNQSDTANNGRINGYGGGGASDIRLVSGEWNYSKSLASRIMVAAGGGGATDYAYPADGGYGGTLTGASGITGHYPDLADNVVPTGGTQTTGGSATKQAADVANDGTFGVGGNGNSSWGSGGGGGYYGGGGGSYNSNRVDSGAGGSSYISGYTGSVAINGENDLTPKTDCNDGTTDISCSYHYSGKKFTNTVMKSGNEEMPNYDGTDTMTGNSGSGLVKITFNGTIEKNYTIDDAKVIADMYEADYNYTGSVQEFVAPVTAEYKFETWGAQGGTETGTNKAGYASGILTLNKGDKVYVYVGQQGDKTSSSIFNGGGLGGYVTVDSTIRGNSGGGATDIRLVPGDWDNNQSLASRIMVAAGSGGGTSSTYESGGNNSVGGGLTGGDGGYYSGHGNNNQNGKGATQTSGGAAGVNHYGANGDNYPGTFGQGGTAESESYALGSGGGGGGYYGGGSGGGTQQQGHGQGGGGGSSYVSGYLGSVAIQAEDNTNPKYGCDNGTTDIECSYHYSGKIFSNPVIIDGNGSMPTYDGIDMMTGNSGDGHARITFANTGQTPIDKYNDLLTSMDFTDYFDVRSYSNIKKWKNLINSENDATINGIITKEDGGVRVNNIDSRNTVSIPFDNSGDTIIYGLVKVNRNYDNNAASRIFEVYSGLPFGGNTPMIWARSNTVCVDSYNNYSCSGTINFSGYNLYTLTINNTTKMLRLYINGEYVTERAYNQYGNVLTLSMSNSNSASEFGDNSYRMVAIGNTIPSDNTIRMNASKILNVYNNLDSVPYRKDASLETSDVYTAEDYITRGLKMHLDALDKGDSDSTWKDLSGNNNDATINNLTYDTNRKSYSFTGSNSNAELQNSSISVTDEETVEIMFTPGATSARNETLYAGNNNEKVSISVHSGFIIVGLAINYSTYYLPSDFYDGKIKFMSVVYDNGDYKVYYNNELLQKRDNLSYINKNTSTYIGRRNDGYYFLGDMYNVKVYDKALKYDEIVRNYNVNITRYNLDKEIVRRLPTLDKSTQNGRVVSTTNSTIYNAEGAYLNIDEAIVEIDKEGNYQAIENHGQVTVGDKGYVNALKNYNRAIYNAMYGDILPGTGTLTSYYDASYAIYNDSMVDTSFGGYNLVNTKANSYGIYNNARTDLEVNQINSSGLGIDIYDISAKELTINNSTLSCSNGSGYSVTTPQSGEFGDITINGSHIYNAVLIQYNTPLTITINNSTIENTEKVKNRQLLTVAGYWGTSRGTMIVNKSTVNAYATAIINGNDMTINNSTINRFKESDTNNYLISNADSSHATMNLNNTIINNKEENDRSNLDLICNENLDSTLNINGGSINTIGKIETAIRNRSILNIKNEFVMSDNFKYGIITYYDSGNFNHNTFTNTIGENDSTVSTTYPVIKGYENAILSDQKSITNFYDGKLIGKDDIAMYGVVNSVPNNYDINSTVNDTIQEITLKANNSEAEEDQVAQIGNTKYASLQAAIDAVPETGVETEIKIIKDIDTALPVETKSTQNIKLNYNGHFVKSYVTDKFITSNGKLTLADNSNNVKESKSYSKSYIYTNNDYEHNDVNLTAMYNNAFDIFNLNGTNSTFNSGVLKSLGTIINNNSDLTIEGGDFITTNTINDYNNLINNLSGTLTINGGYFDQTSKGTIGNDSTVIIHDGVFVGRRQSTFTVINNSTGDLTIDGGTFDNTNAKGTAAGQHCNLVSNKGTASVKDITINYYGLFDNNGGDLTFDNIIAKNIRYESTSKNGTLTIKDSELEGNKLLNDTNSTMTIDHSKLKSNDPIYNRYSNSKLIITNGTEISYDSTGQAIYVEGVNNSLATLEIDNSVIKNYSDNRNTESLIRVPGNSNIILKSGTIKNTKGHGIYSSGVNVSITLGEEGGVPSTTDPKIEASNNGIYNPDKNTTINFYDGIIIGTTAINGTVSTTEDGYDIILDTVDGKEHKYLDQLPAIKNIDQDKDYDDIQSAINEAVDGDTLQLQREVTIFNNTPTIVNTKTLIFDLNGNKIINNNATFMNNEGILQIVDSKETFDSNNIYNGKGIIENTGTILFNNTGTLTIDSGELTSVDKEFIINTGLLTINNGNFHNSKDGWIGEVNLIENNIDTDNNKEGEVYINGGYFFVSGAFSAVVKNNNYAKVTGGTYYFRGYNYNGYHVGYSSVINNVTASSESEISGGTYPYHNGGRGNLVDNNGTSVVKNITTTMGYFANNKAGGTMTIKDVVLGDGTNYIGNDNFITNNGTLTIDNLTTDFGTNSKNATIRILNNGTGNLHLKNSVLEANSEILYTQENSTTTIEDSTLKSNITVINMRNSSSVTMRQTGPSKTMLIESTASSTSDLRLSYCTIRFHSTGTLNIESGNIKGENIPTGIYMSSNPSLTTPVNILNVGSKDGNVNETPVIRAKLRSVYYDPSTGNYYNNNSINFYDGKFVSQDGLLERVNEVETGYTIIRERVSGNEEAYLANNKSVAKTNTASFNTLKEAFDNSATTDTIQLLKDVTLSGSDSSIEIASTKNLKLDLNGHKIYISNKEAIKNSATLEITDSTNDKLGEIIIVNEDSIINNGTITFTTGKIYSDRYIKQFITNNGTFTLDGGTISANSPMDDQYMIINNGTFNMYSGKLETVLYKCNYSQSRYPATNQIFNASTGTVNITGGYINKPDGGTTVMNEGTLYVTGGIFNENLPNQCYFEQLFNNNTTTSIATITGGTYGSTTSKIGKALIANKGTATIDSISYYSSVNVSAISNTGTLTLNGVTMDAANMSNSGTLNVTSSTIYNDESGRTSPTFALGKGTINITSSNLSNKYSNVIKTDGWPSDPTSNIIIESSTIAANSPTPDKVFPAILLNNRIPNYLQIKSGTISSATGNALEIEGNNTGSIIEIGESGGTPNISNPELNGKLYGLYNPTSSEMYFYDGVIKGQSGSIYGVITDTAAGYKEKRDNVTNPETGVTSIESTLTVVGTSERVAVVNNVNFLSLQSAINYASNNGYSSIQMYKSVELTDNLVLPDGGNNVTIYLGNFIITIGAYNVDSGITIVNGTDPGANLSRFLANITGQEINPKNIVLFEMSDGTRLNSSTIYKLYKVMDGEDKIVKVKENKIGDYDLGSSTEDLRTVRGKIYINGIGEGTYKLIGSDSKEMIFTISSDSVSNNIRVNNKVNSNRSVTTFATLILQLQTGMVRSPYMIIIMMLIICILGFVAYQKYKKED